MRRFGLVLVLAGLLAGDAAAQDESRLLRFPAIHGDRIAFTYAGNLYTVPARGGIARRLTSHDGFEMFARFSPDGKWLAFTGQYDGNTEVFVIPSQGGVPRRLTFTATLGRDDVSDRMGPNNIVMGWKNDGRHIVFRSRMHESNDFIGQLFTVPLAGGLPEQLPLPRGGFCSFSPDDGKLAYNRVFREFRTWKRYRGGMADDIWIHDFRTKETVAIATNPASDTFPMWHGNQIYFTSDRDANLRFNLWVYDLATKAVQQLTHFAQFDVKFPSIGDKAIVFENGGWIYRFDLASKRTERVPIQVLDDNADGRGGLIKVGQQVTNYEISPDGKRALFGARGDVFTVPAQHGPTRNLTQTPGIHERNSKWSPDGKHIAYISDSSGEDEIWMRTPDGAGKPIQLTTGGDTYKYEPQWSPDSKKILWTDKKLRLCYVDVATRQITQALKAPQWEIHEASWSPDSQWIAYIQPDLELPSRLYLYNLASRQSTAVTDEWYNSSQPAFSADGKYLFFVSDRDFNPTFGRTEFNHIYQDMSRIYFVTLQKDAPNPLKPRSDEAQPPAPARASEPKKEDAAAKKPAIDANGIAARIVDLPIQAASYRHLTSVGETLYYIRQGSKDAQPQLQSYDLAARKEAGHGNVAGYEISTDGKKMLISRPGGYSIIDLPKGAIAAPEQLNLGDMEMKLDRHAEWAQIFRECWRQMRDFFYDPTMHGVDWLAMRAKYEPLVPFVNHRADLTYIVGEMIAELNAGHAYVGLGDLPRPRRIPMGLLGAELKRDAATGSYRIAKILPGANWDRALRSPLTELGLGVKEGDYILAVNGQPTKEMANIQEALIGTAGKQVTLRINATPAEAGSREVVVVPTEDEAKLYYHQWVQGNIKKVSDATEGKVGYLHVPDMLTPGLNEFSKHYYPQLRKKALIIDMRGNGGGNVSPQLIERLRREIAMIGIARNSVPTIDPRGTLHGPMVCLLNEFSASDGDLFPYRFRHYGLGKLIGKRSWGGVVGIRGTLPLLDGGSLSKPEFSRYDVAGKVWIIEGKGVEPDIVVDNDPGREFAGSDDQLTAGIKHILEELKTKEKILPPVPPYPRR